MDSKNTTELRRLCGRFRNSILAYKQSIPGPPWAFKTYPDNCCRLASNWLGLWLETQGYPGAMIHSWIVMTSRTSPLTHAWLELDGVIIDITADQFGESYKPVIVDPIRGDLHQGTNEPEALDPEFHRAVYDGLLLCLADEELMRLYEACTAVTWALGAIRNSFIELNWFPRGACGAASNVLGLYLTQHGFGDFEYVAGKNGDQTHAWLEQGGRIIDITAKQFSPEIDAVLITTNRAFHNQFKPSSWCPCRSFTADSVPGDEWRMYGRVLNLIEG